jgi:uncharacterized membrane protein YsdA (DUF1294 family)/cold shock CspA family protein
MPAPSPENPHAGSPQLTPGGRSSGRIIEWDAHKGFGFLHDGTHRIFLHSRDFAEHRKTPERGDTVTFVVGKDFTGRTCATNAVITGSTGQVRLKHFITLLILLIGPGFALHRLSGHFDPGLLIATAIVLSLITYLVYVWDKHKARTDGWRTAESTLHLLALIGGWPGAYLAQRWLRHKTAKVSFLIVFWIIVAAHQYLAADYALNWRIARQVTSWASHPATPPAQP